MIDLDYIKDLAKVLDENHLTEISVEQDGKSVTIKREKEAVATTSVLPQTLAVNTEEQNLSSKEVNKKGKAIKSPMVGTFYRAPAADSEPFVEVGSNISSGDVVCIVEAMKLMNEIESEFSGKITEICVDDGQTVEYGQVLMYVE